MRDETGLRAMFWRAMDSPVTTGALIIIDLWLAVWALLPRLYPDPARAGQLGDSFGLITSLFGGLTLLGAGYAVWLQHEELKIARKQARDADVDRKSAEEERKAMMAMLGNQTEALLVAAKFQAVQSIGQMDAAAFQYSLIPPNERLGVEPIGDIQRVNRTRQYAEIVLNEFETRDFDWGRDFPAEKRNPLSKFYLTLVRRTQHSFPSSVTGDADPEDVICLLERLKGELELLGTQVGGERMKGPLYFALGQIRDCIRTIKCEPCHDAIQKNNIASLASANMKNLEHFMAAF